MNPPLFRSKALTPLLLALWLAGCATLPPPPIGLMEVVDRPAEKALLAGMRAYEDGQYPLAERSLAQALQVGLVSARDRAAAHKYLAFIFCTSDRAAACEVEFRRARGSDPSFALSKSEAGHPQWGPVYKRVQP
jgi:Tfp pilus assembly protein PilF